MQREEAVQENTRVSKYISDNKLRPFFHELTKLLLIKKPADPIEFLIEYLEKRNKRQIICLHGYDEELRMKLAKQVANKFNYAIIELSEIYKGKGIADWHARSNEEINEKVTSELKKVSSAYKGIVISGYPNNIVQVDYLQKRGAESAGGLPDRYFVLENNEEKIKAQYERKYEGSIDKLLERNRLEIKELKEILGDQIDWLMVSENGNENGGNITNGSNNGIPFITEKLIQTISLKANKKTAPYDSPRIVILHPPFVSIPLISTLIDTFSLNAISVNDALKRLSHKEDFMKHVESQIRKYKFISKEIELAMVETMCKSIMSKTKGYFYFLCVVFRYALTGWPTKIDRLKLLEKEHFLKPHVVLIFEVESKQDALERFKQLNPDDKAMFAVIKKPSEDEYTKEYDEWIKMTNELKGLDNVQTFKFDEQAVDVIKTFAKLMENPRIYS